MKKLSIIDEILFKKWYTNLATKIGIDPDPDNPLHFYDYRSFYKDSIDNGIDPNSQLRTDPLDGRVHFPSQYKLEQHPRKFLKGIDTTKDFTEDRKFGLLFLPRKYGFKKLF